MPRTTIVLYLLCLAAPGALAESEPSDREAILALMEQAFAAVASQRPESWHAVQLAEGTTLSFSATPGGDPELLNRMRISNNEAFAANVEPDGRILREQWTAEPTVLIRGPIAIVWGEYDFWVDDEFSHCGVDAVDLVKQGSEWKIANWMWTVERSNCPTAP